MVDADAGGDEPAQVLADRRVEAEAVERGLQRLLLGLAERVEGEVVLRRLGGVLLGEVDDVDRRLAAFQQLLDAGVQGGRAVLEVQRHGPLDRGDDASVAPGAGGEVVTEERDVAERGRHQQELGVGELEERHLPGPAPLRVAVVVELVDDGDVDRGRRPVAQRPVGEDLGGAADDRRVGVDRRVAGDHPDAIGAELAAQGEELLADERLDRRGVDAALAFGERGEVGGGGHERLARPGRRVEDHVVADEQFEDRLLLRRVQLEPDLRGVRVEPVEHPVGVAGRCRRIVVRWSLGIGTDSLPPRAERSGGAAP